MRSTRSTVCWVSHHPEEDSMSAVHRGHFLGPGNEIVGFRTALVNLDQSHKSIQRHRTAHLNGTSRSEAGATVDVSL
ncbi:unnamed protein product [Arctogadus glacialis]